MLSEEALIKLDSMNDIQGDYNDKINFLVDTFAEVTGLTQTAISMIDATSDKNRKLALLCATLINDIKKYQENPQEEVEHLHKRIEELEAELAKPNPEVPPSLTNTDEHKEQIEKLLQQNDEYNNELIELRQVNEQITAERNMAYQKLQEHESIQQTPALFFQNFDHVVSISPSFNKELSQNEDPNVIQVLQAKDEIIFGLKNEINALTKENNELQEETYNQNNELQTQVFDLQFSNNQLAYQIDELSRQIERNDSKVLISNLCTCLDCIRDSDLYTKVVSMKEELNYLRAQKVSVGILKTTNCPNCQALETKLSQIQNLSQEDIILIKQKHEQSQNEIVQLKCKLDISLSEIDMLNQKISQINSTNSDLQNQLIKNQEQISEDQKIMIEMQHQVEIVQSEIDQSKNDSKQLEQKINSQIDTLTQMGKEINQICSQNSGLVELCEPFQQLLEKLANGEYQESLESFTHFMESLNDTHELINDLEANDASSRVASLLVQIKDLQREIDLYRKTNREISTPPREASRARPSTSPTEGMFKNLVQNSGYLRQ